MKKSVTSSHAPAAIGAYSQAIESSGWLFLSGQIPINPSTGSIPHGIEAQTSQCLHNIQAILEEKNCTMENVVDVQVMLTDMDMFSQMNETYSHFFKEPFPARAAFGVVSLPRNVLVEIKVTAKLNEFWGGGDL